MKGRMIIYRCGGSLADPPEVRMIGETSDWSDPNANLDALRKIVDDDIEQVPYFDTIQIDDKVRPCIVLCGEHGKLNGLKVNRQATMLWRAALTERKDMTEPARRAVLADVLVGTVVILTGDPEFMESL